MSAESCEFMLGCAAAPGERWLLSVDAQAVNVGAADLLFGDPRTSSGIHRVECEAASGRQNYAYIDFIDFELLDASGAVAASARAARSPHCPDQVGSRFDESFCGIPRSRDARSGLIASLDSSICPGIDVTDLPAGDYVLQIHVNPDRAFPESDYTNNTLSFSIQIPVLGDPLQSCDNPLLRDECGWGLSPEALCTAGERVAVGCPSCESPTNFRVCAGAQSCSAVVALELEPELIGFTPLDANQSLSCEGASFTCPDSGSYSAMSKAAPEGDVACSPMRFSLDPLAHCMTPILGDWAAAECNWSMALSASCSPGEDVEVGCPLCEGDVALRVCEGAGACLSQDALGAYAEAPGCPNVVISCPASGVYTALLAPFFESRLFRCDLTPPIASDAGVSP